MHIRCAAAAAAIAALTLALAPAAPAQQSFGAHLNRPANATFGCESYPVFVPLFGPTLVGLPDPRSCTWTSAGTFGNLAETANVPGDGTVTRVRIRTGPTTGPMQVVVLRSLSDAPTQETLPAPSQCCQIPVASQVFVPAPNAVTTVPVNLPVQAGRNAQGIGTFDALGLSILAPGVTIPAHDTTAQDGGRSPAFFSPAVAVGTQNVNRNGAKGVQLLLNADWSPAAVSGPAGTPPGVAAPARPIALGARVARVSSGNALVDLICNSGAAACRGTLRLLRRGAPARATAAAAVVYGKRSYRIPAGKRSKVKVKLSRRGRALLRTRRTAKVQLRIAPKGARAITRTLTLRRAKR